MTNSFIDIALKPDKDGIYDASIDPETGDLAVTNGLETAILVSLFTDRRAHESEMRDLMKRRGWIGDPYSEIARGNGDKTGYGSGYWLYEQARLNGETERGMYFETLDALKWLSDSDLALAVDAQLTPDPGNRGLKIAVQVSFPDAGTSEYAWNIWRDTAQGQLY